MRASGISLWPQCFGLAEAGIHTIDGMLGGDILFENNAVIDYSNLSLTFNVVK